MASQVQVVMSGEEAKLWRAQQRILAQQKKLEGGYERVKRKGQDAGQTTQKAFGARHQASIDRLVGRYVGLSTAVQQVGEMMQFVRQETDLAVASMTELTGQRRKLSQVATSVGDFGELGERGDRLASREGVDRQVVRDLLFDARSRGFEDIVDRIVSTSRVVEPGAQAVAAGQVPDIFQGAISPLQGINVTLAAAQKSALDFKGIVEQLPVAAEGVQLAGGSATEAAGLLSVLAGQFAGRTGAMRVKALGTKFGISEGFEGLGVVEGVEKLAGMSADQRKKFLGESQELNVAYAKILENLPTIKERIGELETALETAGTSASPLSRAQRIAFDPRTREGQANIAEKELARARIDREIAREERLAGRGAGARVVRDRLLADMSRRGFSGKQQFGASKAMEFAESLGAGPLLTGLAGGAGAAGASGLLDLPGLFRGLSAGSQAHQAAAGAQMKAAERLEAAAENLRQAAQERTRRPASSNRALQAQQARAGGGIEAN